MSKITPRGPLNHHSDGGTTRERCVKVTFGKIGNTRICACGDQELRIGDTVIFQEGQGREAGMVTADPEVLEVPLGHENRICRRADGTDLEHLDSLRREEHESFRICRERVASFKLPMKLLAVDWRFDRKKVTFHFSAESRVDFRMLVRDLASIFRCRIELHQVGVRDQARLIGGYGVCGRELCCAGCLTGFNPVSMKMARTQNLPINPGKLSGACGRLKCCLEFEYENYAEEREGLVDPGTKVIIGGEEFTVGHIDILRGKVLLHEESGRRREMSKCEFCRSGYVEIAAGRDGYSGRSGRGTHPDG